MRRKVQLIPKTNQAKTSKTKPRLKITGVRQQSEAADAAFLLLDYRGQKKARAGTEIAMIRISSGNPMRQ